MVCCFVNFNWLGYVNCSMIWIRFCRINCWPMVSQHCSVSVLEMLWLFQMVLSMFLLPDISIYTKKLIVLYVINDLIDAAKSNETSKVCILLTEHWWVLNFELWQTEVCYGNITTLILYTKSFFLWTTLCYKCVHLYKNEYCNVFLVLRDEWSYL